MAGFVGRTVALTWNGAAVAGCREKKVAATGAAVDVSSDEDLGYRVLLDVAQQNELNISLSGVTKASVLRADWMAGTRTRAVVLTYPDGSVISGNFYMSNYNEGLPYKDAVTFDVELQSTGAWAYTPGA